MIVNPLTPNKNFQPMERTEMYTKDDIASALGIHLRLVNDRIHKLNDPELLKMYHCHKFFSHTQFMHIIDRLHGYLGINDSETDNGGGVKNKYVFN